MRNILSIPRSTVLQNEDRIWIPKYMCNYSILKNDNKVAQLLNSHKKVYVDVLSNKYRLTTKTPNEKHYGRILQEKDGALYDGDGNAELILGGYEIVIYTQDDN